MADCLLQHMDISGQVSFYALSSCSSFVELVEEKP